jgi:hypothetical protein
VNRLQDGLLNTRIALRASRLNCRIFFFQMGTHTFFINSDRDFNSENNNVSELLKKKYVFVFKKKNILTVYH